MSDIVTILPPTSRQLRVMRNRRNAVALAILLGGVTVACVPVDPGPSADFIQPDITEAPVYVLVGTGCGERDEMLLAMEEDGFPPSGCREIEVHEVASGAQ